MDNPETLKHWAHKTQDEDKLNTTKKTKKMSNVDATKIGSEPRCSVRVRSSCLLYDTRHVTYIVKTCRTSQYANKHK